MASITGTFLATVSAFDEVGAAVDSLRAMLAHMTIDDIQIVARVTNRVEQSVEPEQEQALVPEKAQPQGVVVRRRAPIEPRKNAVSLTKFGYCNVTRLADNVRYDCLTDAADVVGTDNVLSKLLFLKSVFDCTRGAGLVFKNDYDWLASR